MKPLLICLLAAVPLIGGAAQTDIDSMQTSQKLVRKVTRTEKADYLLFLPKGYESGGTKKWPLIIFLHGAGERGTNVQKVAAHGPPKIVAERPDLPFIIVSPQCPPNQRWSPEVVLALLDETIEKHRVDTNRIYLTGLSMGGFGTWDIGLKYPERFAALAPICGGGNAIDVLLASGKKREAIRGLGIWAFHGEKDPTVNVSESRRMVEALEKAGMPDVRLTVYPEARHDSWTETYANPELYTWFLKHTRKVD